MGFFPFYYFSECIYHWGLMGFWSALLVRMFFCGGILIIHYKALFVTHKGRFFKIR